MTTLHDVAAQAVRTHETRQAVFELRATAPADSDERTIEGLGVPYGVEIEHYFGRESFDPGSIEDADSARLLWQHRDPIGRVSATSDSDEGMSITGVISRTQLGDDALTLARDGVVTGLSIGFEPLEYRIEVNEDDDTEVLRWTRVRAREFSLVTFPAYDPAQITDVRSRDDASRKEPHMPAQTEALTRADLDPIETSIQDLERAVAQASAATPADTLASESRQWRSMGDFVRALATGDEQATAFYERAFAGAGTADASAIEDGDGTGWLGTFIRFVQERRRTLNLFSTGTLPADGMRVDYAKLTGDTLAVGKQAAQGDDLAGPGKLTFANDSDPVETYGGWTGLSRQLIERSAVPYLDTVWTALGLRYARTTDQAVRDRLLAEITGIVAGADPDDVIELPAAPDAYDWIDGIVDAGELYVDRGFDLAGLLVDKARFKELARMTGTDGRPLMTVFGQGVNTTGVINAKDGNGNMAGVPVQILWKAPAGTSAFYDPIALKTLEQPGAPFRLQDDNIINLTRSFSLYGYLGIITPFPEAIVPVTFAD